jgi:hypothetical protein
MVVGARDGVWWVSVVVFLMLLLVVAEVGWLVEEDSVEWEMKDR